MATVKKAAPKAKKKAAKKVIDGKAIAAHVAKLPYKQRDHLINHLSVANQKDSEAFSLGKVPDGSHYATYEPE